MRRLAPGLLAVVCLSALTFACYGRAIFRGEQFSYRDAGHYYYPLYERVQAGWRSGHWPPLWEPEENSGMPLLGNPTAAVLYPGKLIFAVMPYPVGARVYIIAHTLLAFVAMATLLRTWGTSWPGSTVGALAYAFGAPILFQYCNVIYLVGAAWAPLGFRAADRWLRLGRRLAIPELAVVLTMEVLGGDPETAYLTGVCAGAYALMLARARRSRGGGPEPSGVTATRGAFWLRLAGLVAAVGVWAAVTLIMARLADMVRPPRVSNNPPLPLPWMGHVPTAVNVVWLVVGLALLRNWWEDRAAGGRRGALVPMLAGLAASATLAGMLAAAQLFPVAEFTGMTSRAAEAGPHDIYPFSFDPWRVVEFVWPNVFGTPFGGNRYWLNAFSTAKIWIPTLYLGGLTTLLALGAARFRMRPDAPWRAWLSWVAVVSLVVSTGEYGSPLYWARFSPAVAARVGGHDKHDDATIRFDRHLRDGDGGPYWLLATVLPGFRQFRFPSKLLTLTVLALAALAGQGWDSLLSGDVTQRKRSMAWGSWLLGLTLLTLAVVAFTRPAILDWLNAGRLGNMFGPFEAPGAFASMVNGLAQGAAVTGLGLVVLAIAPRRPGVATALGLTLLTADLALANSQYVLTAPQALFDKTPGILEVIRDAEMESPSPGPYRVHRMPLWSPVSWVDTASKDRVRDFIVWEHDTLQPKSGITDGVNFTATTGVAELYDYQWFFNGYTMRPEPEVSKLLKAPAGKRLVAFPRRSFDLWTTRYFVLPYYQSDWTDENRGFASFLENTERIYPPKDAFAGPGGQEKELAWVRDHDVQVLRNRTTYPRAWVVHQTRSTKTVRGLNRDDREEPMKEMIFMNDLLWRDPSRSVFDPRALAWVDEADILKIAPTLSGRPPSASESAEITLYDAEQVELDANLMTPGLVVLADVDYPGWELTIDNKPAPLYRVNRLMRGAAVEAGKHHLVYRFRPLSFRVGLWVSVAGLLTLGWLVLVLIYWPTGQAQGVSHAFPD